MPKFVEMSARLNPESSISDACLHLFRYLYDYEELRRNPIFRERFYPVSDRGSPTSKELHAFDALRATITAVVDECRRSGSFGRQRGSFTERHYMIVVEHALNRRPAGDVARQLGLSIRQFYRDRSRAYAHVLSVLMQGAKPARAHSSAAIDCSALALGKARFFIDNAKYRIALTILDGVGREAADIKSRLEALCIAAEVLCWQEHFAEALRTIDDARRVLSAHGKGERTPSNLARLDLVTATYNFEMLRTASAREALASALNRLQTHSVDGDDEDSRQLLVMALILESTELEHVGQFRLAYEKLQLAKSTLARVAAPHPGLSLDLSIALSSLAQDIPGCDFASVTAALQEAQLKAQQLGYARHALTASLCLALTGLFLEGSHQKARRITQEGVRVASQLGDSRLTAEICIDAALAEMAAKNYVAAETLLARAENLSQPRGINGVVLYLYKADAHRLRGRYSESLAAGEKAQKVLRNLGNPRLKSAVARVMAEAHARAGNAEQAREYIARAVDIGQRCASANSLAAIYAASARITGNRAHARQAALIGRLSLD